MRGGVECKDTLGRTLPHTILKEAKMKSGIYGIKNKINNKIYVGQTYDFNYRWGKHKIALRSNTHSNKKLQFAWNKYGEDNFEFFVIEECGLDIINEREVYWIEFYDSLNSGYNLCEGGNGIRGYKHTEEEIQKMIQIQHPRAVYALDREHNIVMEFPSASTAAKKLGTSSRLIKSVAERVNRQKTARGYIWVYKDEYDSGVVDWDYYDNYNRDFPKAIKQFDLDGNFIQEFNSKYEAQKLGFCSSQIWRSISRPGITASGYYWIESGTRVEIEKLQYIVYDRTSEKEFVFYTKADIAKKYKIGTEKVTSLLNTGVFYKDISIETKIIKIVCE